MDGQNTEIFGVVLREVSTVQRVELNSASSFDKLRTVHSFIGCLSGGDEALFVRRITYSKKLNKSVIICAVLLKRTRNLYSSIIFSRYDLLGPQTYLSAKCIVATSACK